MMNQISNTELFKTKERIIQSFKDEYLKQDTYFQTNVNYHSLKLKFLSSSKNFIDQIETAKDTKAILKIWEDMKTKSFLTYNVDIKKQDEHLEEFKNLDLEEQKQHLVSILDKNQLYINQSNLNDKDCNLTAEEINVTKDFYQIK